MSITYAVRVGTERRAATAGEERRGARGAREVPYRATGKSWRIEVVDETQGRANTAALVEAFIDDVRRVGAENVDAARLGLRLTPTEYKELKLRLAELLDDFV